MRRFLHLLFGAVVIAAMVSACTDDKPIDPPAPEPPVESDPVLTLESSSITASTAGGQFSVNYTLENALEGISLLAKCEVAWISDITVTDKSIDFAVAPNTESEERSAKIALKYPGIEQQEITVTQENFADELFTITISDITSSTCVSKVTPADPTMEYIVFMSSVSYLQQMGILTEEALVSDDRSYFIGLAEEYGVNLGAFMRANVICMKGESNIKWTGMSPGDDFVVYVYGIKFNDDESDYVQNTPMYHAMVTPAAATLQDIKFIFNYEISGPQVTHTVTPENWDGAFFYEYFPEGSPYHYPEGTEVTEIYIESVASDWLMLVNAYMGSGYGAQEFVDMACYYGTHSFTNTLQANTKYMAQAYAIDVVDGIPQVVSLPVLTYFRTEEVTMSDMTFDISLENVYARVADVVVTPSNNDDPYTIAIVPTADIEGTTNSEIMQWLISTFQLGQYKGVVTSHLNTLQPDTDYTMLVFGYYGGTLTTDLTRIDFSTEPAGVGENRVLDILHDGPYSPRALANYDPENYGHLTMYEDYGYVLFWSEIVVETPTPDIFHYHYTLDKIMYGNDYLIEDLTSFQSSEPWVMLTAREDVTFVLCGLALDYRGNYSELFMTEPFSYNLDQCRPIDELIEYMNAGTTRGKLMLMGNDGRSIDISRELMPEARTSQQTAPVSVTTPDTNTIDKSAFAKPYKGFMPIVK